MTRLTVYGSDEQAHNVAKVGKKITPVSLAERMPSPDLLAKVGMKQPTPGVLAARMPSPEVAAKVGISPGFDEPATRRVVRRNAHRDV